MTPDDDFIELVERFQAMGYYFVLKRDPSTHDAEECVQETFLKMHQKWDKLRAHPNKAALFFVMLNQTFVDRHRKRKALRIQHLGFDDELPDRFPTKCPLEREELRGILRDAIEILRSERPEEAAVLESRFDGSTHSETMVALGLTNGTAASRYSRALDWLRKFLGGDDFMGGKAL